MKSITDIKSRIKSISETRQITNAMELISISKLKRVQAKFEKNMVYFDKLKVTIKDIVAHSKDIFHKYLTKRRGTRAAYIVISSDKGLAGGYNLNVLNAAWEHMQSKEEKYVFTIGHTATDYFRRMGQNVDVEFLHVSQNPTLADARNITFDVFQLYDNNLMDEVFIVFTDMFSTGALKPEVYKLLPVIEEDMTNTKLETDYLNDILYDPSPIEVLDFLIPQYVVGMMYTALIHASASEHKARMLAMENATINADEMLAKLKLDYNRARQEKITNELLEIVSAANMAKKS